MLLENIVMKVRTFFVSLNFDLNLDCLSEASLWE